MTPDSPDTLISELRKLDACIAKARRMRAKRYEALKALLSGTMKASGIGLRKISAARGFTRSRVLNVIYNENGSLSADEWQALFDFIDKEVRRRERQRRLIESLAPGYDD